MKCLLYCVAGEEEAANAYIAKLRLHGYAVGPRNASVFLRSPGANIECDRGLVLCSKLAAKVAEHYANVTLVVGETVTQHKIVTEVVDLEGDLPTKRGVEPAAVPLMDAGEYDLLGGLEAKPNTTTEVVHTAPAAVANGAATNGAADLPPVTEAQFKEWRFFKLKAEVKARTGVVPKNKPEARAALEAGGHIAP